MDFYLCLCSVWLIIALMIYLVFKESTSSSGFEPAQLVVFSMAAYRVMFICY